MTRQRETKAKIQRVIRDFMKRVMKKALQDNAIPKDTHTARDPLYAAFLPNEIVAAVRFERTFAETFAGVWEKLAVVAATAGLGHGTASQSLTGSVNQERLRRISEVLNNLEHVKEGEDRIKPDWDAELEFILAGKSKNIIPVTVVTDVYAEDKKSKRKYAFELKAPLPNSDQTKVSKEKLLKLYCMEPLVVDEAYFALPYNPYGRREAYAWSFPARWFDMKTDKVVLIGDEFWDKIGGCGTYQAFVDAVNEVGVEYKERIYREYLGIEPPSGAFETKL